MDEISNDQLAEAIRGLHGSRAEWLESVPVKETFRGQTVWEGEVQIFRLLDHPTCKRCYAWSHALDDTENRKVYAVLHEGPVDSPVTAVRASIVADSK